MSCTPPNLLGHMRKLAVSVVCVCSVAFVSQARAQSESVSGKAHVVDGDTIDIGTTRIRLWGIDAPEGKQQCSRESKTYDCGNEASKKLLSLIGSQNVECLKKTQDRYKRMVAVCRAGGKDIGAEMVRSGWALAFTRYSSDYVSQENEARLNGRGMWAGAFEPPWQVRKR